MPVALVLVAAEAIQGESEKIGFDVNAVTCT